MQTFSLYQSELTVVPSAANSLRVKITQRDSSTFARLEAVGRLYRQLQSGKNCVGQEFFAALDDEQLRGQLNVGHLELIESLRENQVEVIRRECAFEFAVSVSAEIEPRGYLAKKVSVATYQTYFGSVFGVAKLSGPRSLMVFSVPDDAGEMLAEIRRICGE